MRQSSASTCIGRQRITGRPSRTSAVTPHAGCDTSVGSDSGKRSGSEQRIDASTIQRASPSVTITVPWFGGSSGATSIVPTPRTASKPSAASSAHSAPLPAQQVPPVPSASQSAKKSAGSSPGSGPGSPVATWMRLRTLSNGTRRHHAE
jgi:hypothetical protein